MDRMRLVFPPLPASVIGLLIFGCYTLFSPWSVAETLFAGTLVGYMAYDLTHYYVHHGTPTSVYFSNLKRYHVKHHFEHQQLGECNMCDVYCVTFCSSHLLHYSLHFSFVFHFLLSLSFFTYHFFCL